MSKKPFRTWLEIDYKAISENVGLLKKLLSKEVAMMAVVKSNAYGHGIIESAKAAIKGGANWLAVDEITEAIELRNKGIKVPVLVLGFTLPEYYKIASSKNISLTISSNEALKKIAEEKFSKKIKIHLKFDTGLHRQGIMPTDIGQTVRILTSSDFPAVIEGAYTHFAIMEMPDYEDYSREQMNEFNKIIDRLKIEGFSPITHASASSGILFSKDFHCDMSRAGISMYGLWPSIEIKDFSLKKMSTSLKPSLTWKTIVSEVKIIERGARVGYDLTFETERDSRIAIIPVGYWHGIPRAYSSKGKEIVGQVLVGGKRANIIGRVSMDMTIIDITDIPSVKVGDEVIIIGKQGNGLISAEEMAEKCGTINYEIVTRINPVIERIGLYKK